LNRTILPGATIGVLGSGQLGRMFAIAARRMGYRVHTLSPEGDTPTGHISDVEINAPYDDLDAVRKLAAGVDVMTFEFENVPAASAEAAAELVPVRPAGSILQITQNRLREKSFLSSHGFPVTPFVSARDEADLRQLAPPVVVKTASWGYDGKGQIAIRTPGELEGAWGRLATDEAIVEKMVDFVCELSVVVARTWSGEVRAFEVTRNHHTRNILDHSIAPAGLRGGTTERAQEIGRAIAEEIDLVGVLCVEMFLTRDGEILVNELAPRPHNSGHWTFDAAVTSQFEQQVRAICGLPLGSPQQLRPAAMANLLGDLWEGGEPDWAAACRYPEVKLHLYGKSEARPGRKMGHLTAMAASADEALELVLAARRALVPSHALRA
jgi:5-(carboxyamino)imidazole ribonucleotide synthase